METLALTLLGIPSVIGHEAALADHVEAWAGRHAMSRVVRAGDNLAIRPRALRPGVPHVLLLGHLDTVPTSDDNPPRLEGGRIYGLGATDMKCADAVILHLLAKSLAQAPRYDLSAVLYAREEGPYDESGMPEIVQAAPDFFEGVDLAIAMEPTDNHFELGCLGTMHARVRFEGRRAHSARPWEGRNAIHLAAPLLAALAALEPREIEFDGLTFREICLATMVDYEGARNVVPGRLDVNVNFRFGPDRSRTQAMTWLNSFVLEAVGEKAFSQGEVTVAVTDLCPSGRVCADNPLLATLRTASGGDKSLRAKQAWTDVGRLSEMGIEAINFGPGSGSQAHQVGEYCLRANLEASRVALEAWLAL